MGLQTKFRTVTKPTILRFNLAAFPTALCLLLASCISAAGESPARFGASQATVVPGNHGTAERVRVAQGEYKVLTEAGIGPFLPAVYGFDESWTLWRLADGSLEVSGTRTYRSPAYESQSNEFSAHLSADFRVLGLKEFRKLKWRPDSGPLSCDFLAGRIACSSNAKDASQNVSLNLSMKEPFGFMWPVSAFSLASVTRFVTRDPERATPVQLVRVEEVSRADPALATILSGDLKYLGQEELSLADRKWRADKFELKVPLHAPFVIWTSPEGLLLGFAPENNHKMLSDEGMRLVSFQQWQAF